MDPITPSTWQLPDFAVPTLLAALAISLFLFRARTSRKGPLPPGPEGIPFFGNLFQLPPKRPWVKMEEWTREYGPIYTLWLGQKPLVVLGRASSALALLDQRSSIYSSRPRLIMTSDIVSRGLRMTFMPYGARWRSQRKLLHQLTKPDAAKSYEPIQEQESAQLIRDLGKTPESYWGHAQRYAGSTIMQIAFNKRALTPEDPAITEMRAVNEKMTKTAVAGRYIVDSIPVLNYLPHILAPWKREGDRLFVETLALFTKHVNAVKKDIKEGRDVHCFTRYILELQKSYGLQDDEATFLSGAMYGAGSDTTSDAISTFLMTMVAHPHVVKKAQEELDRVVGRNRLVEFADQEDLVYCNAVVRETLRWRTVIAGGLAHCTTEDDVYEGYFIPKGTAVVANHWAIHLDPELYPEPETFNPDRFIKDDQLVGTKYSERGHHAYGFGRRICPGQHIADRSLFIVFSRLLWAFNITNAKDSSGSPIPVDINAFSEGFSSHPLHFECDIQARGPWVQEAVDLALSSTVA
ncbi:putative O-methylsterigmatocystin oxidoreductase [Meredithblackwellia eburnea MCA 4105]